MNRTSAFASITIAFALAASFPAAGANIAGGLGAGDATCTDFLADPGPSPERNIYVQWASGQISGMIATTSQQYPQDLSVASLAQSLKSYCQANPQESIFVAATTIGKKYKNNP